MKTTLATTALSTRISAVPWEMILRLNGGLVATWRTSTIDLYAKDELSAPLGLGAGSGNRTL